MRAFRRYVGRSVTVQVDEDQSIRGTVIDASADVMTLDEASVIVGDRVIPADGVIAVMSARILWVQVL